LAIWIGPVQDFIVAARRTRDLWFGSTVLSEVSRAAAQAIGDGLIFPASANAPNIANVILAEVADEGGPETPARAASKAALERWEQYGREARKLVSEIVSDERWARQVQDVLEVHWAWTPLPSDPEYAAARRRVMRLLSGRHQCRDFAPGLGEDGVPKSSLDGARETVWMGDPKDLKMSDELARKLRLSPGEQLDAVGVVKRLAEGTQNYPSVSRIAADPWLRGLERRDPTGLEELRDECESLAKAHLLTRVNWKHFEVFPFEGTSVYRNRHKELEKETQGEGRFEKLGGIVRRLERHGIPSPYLAVIAADGDRMGRTLGKIESAAGHREFSRQLATFAREARETIEGWKGHLIYSGGDDVLALAPVDHALECAWELRRRFGELLKDWADAPTLSVGIAIGHFMEALEDLLDRARKAESDAKRPDRDGLALHFYPRSGAPLRLRGSWSGEADTRLAEQIPDKAGYDLNELAREYNGWPTETDEEKANLRDALRADAVRLMRRKRARRPLPDDSPLARMAGAIGTVGDAAGLARKIILAARIADAKAQAGERPAAEEAKP
jgi:CRISPR-associated protein Cmr2